MRFIISFILTAFISTGFGMAALATDKAFPFLLISVAIWVLFIWRAFISYDRKRSRRLQREAYQQYQNAQMMDYYQNLNRAKRAVKNQKKK